MASSGSRSGREDLGSRGVDITQDLERTLSYQGLDLYSLMYQSPERSGERTRVSASRRKKLLLRRGIWRRPKQEEEIAAHEPGRPHVCSTT
ncbi:hypothetical protein FRX31_008133 [Thalictrum thalictroides]|uniref:Uncharacterized protein n=1 Tax=Thalictrum thalictroides TaxID=46969 RepID=A0A7J6WXV5_THATH|nr:hypothetical protein FRX31_008133 [Thalictrum thalictroides]